MLVRSDGLLIGQPAHAWVSGQLARAWGNAAFPPPDPREPFCLAAEQHDVGWSDADLAPLAGPDGRPLSFLEQPRAAHVAIWRDAARRLLAQSRYAALLVSLHGTSLYARVDPDFEPPEVAAAIRGYLAGERELQSRLMAGLDPAGVDTNRRLLLALDRLSLMLCHERATTLADVPAAAGTATLRLEPAGERGADPARPADSASAAGSAGAADSAGAAGAADSAGAAGAAGARDDRAVPAATATARFTLDPWPFAADAVAVGCEARRLADGAGDLAAALAAAPWVPLRWELSRA